MVTREECKINGLRLTEFKYENLMGTPAIHIAYALTQNKIQEDESTRVLHTHGKVTATGASLTRPTLTLIEELIAAIERDLAPRHFEITKAERVTKENEDAGTRTASEESEDVNQI